MVNTAVREKLFKQCMAIMREPAELPAKTFEEHLRGKNLSRYTTEEMRRHWDTEDGATTKDEKMVCYFTSRETAKSLLAGPGIRPAGGGHHNGGLSVSTLGPHEMGWQQWGGGDFRVMVGHLLWSQKYKDVLPGEKDADKLDICFFIRSNHVGD